jgi:Cys-tRNA(Pro)/Cys-tRNA(Cys) deacylase
MTETPVTKHLDSLGIPYRLFQHAGPVESLEQAARERGQRPEQVVRSILFRLPDENYVMVLVAGPTQISWPALRSLLGQRRLTLATPAEVLQVTGYVIGSVSPFGLPSPLRILLDRSVLAEAEVSLGSGQRGLGVILSSADLRRALPAAEEVSL